VITVVTSDPATARFQAMKAITSKNAEPDDLHAALACVAHSVHPHSAGNSASPAAETAHPA
jgi:hypothetical protein